MKRLIVGIFVLIFTLHAGQILLTLENEASVTGANGKVLGGSFVPGLDALAKVKDGNRAMAFGGLKDGVLLPNYTLPNTGSIQFFTKHTAAMIPGQGMTYFYSAGTPPYHNCICMGASVKADGSGTIAASFINAKGIANPVTRLEAPIEMEAEDWQHIALTWCNINSGKADACGNLYVNGKLVASFKDKKVDVPSPAKEVYIGSVEQVAQSNHCGAGAFVMDEVLIMDTVPTQSEIAAKAAVLKKRTTLVDGQSFPRLPIMGGGQHQYRTVSVPDFPAEAGTIFCKVKLAAIIPGRATMVYNACATPPWNDRIAMMLNMKEGNKVEIYPVIVGAPSKVYNSRTFGHTVVWDPAKEHTLAFQWKNVNSGSVNLEASLWFDGINVTTRKNLESHMSKFPATLRLGGEEPPSGGPVEKDLLTILDFRLWKGEAPSAELEKIFNASKNDSVKDTILNLQKLEKAPVIDGKIEPVIWNTCAGMGYLHDFRRGNLAVGNTDIRAAYDKDNLYFLWKAKFDGDKPAGKYLGERDGAIWNEDSIEFYIHTPNGVFQFIVSAHGDIFDQKNQNPAWNSAAAYGVQCAPGEWTGELAVPFSELGVTDATELKGTVVRNVSGLQTNSSCWSPRDYGETGAWTRKNSLIVFNTLALPLPATSGPNSGKIYINNLSDKSNTTDIILTVGKGESAKTTRIRREMTNRSPMELEFDFTAPEEGIQPYSIQVQDSTGLIVYNHTGFIKVNPPLHITTKGYFYKGYLEVTVDASKLQGAKDTGTLELKQGDRAFGKQAFTLKDGKAVVQISTKDLPASGFYQVLTMLQGTDKTFTSTNEFEYATRPTCIDPKAGKGKIYFHDGWFTPVYKDGVVSVWNRTYTWKDSIFPSSVISNGKDLLNGTPYFEYVINGQTKRLSAATVTFTGKDQEKCMFAVAAKDDALRVSADVRVEYDGFIGYKLTIDPVAGKNITRLTMVFPMVAKEMLYKLEGLENTFSMKRDYIPGYPASGKGFSFSFSSGIGCGDRAFFFCCESDEGWLPYDRKDVEKIVPGKDTVQWRWDIVNGAQLGKIANLNCGFQVTPYKQLRPATLTNHKQATIWPGGVFRPGDTPYILKNIKALKALEVNVLQLHQNWCKHTNGIEPDDPELFKQYIKAAHDEGMKVIVYRASITNEYEPSYIHFGDYWVGYPKGGWFGYSVEPPTKRTSIGRCPRSPEYIDWYVGGCKELMEKYDLDGFYYDFGVGGCNNASHGCGYSGKNTTIREGESTGTIGINIGKLSDEDKNRRPTCAIMAQRELWKRMYNMVHELRGDEGIIDAHTSDPARIYEYPFVDTMDHSESGACHADKEPMSLDCYRYYYSKEFLGTLGSPILYAQQEKDYWQIRPMLTLALLHRSMFRFSTGKYQMPEKDRQTYTSAAIWKLLSEFNVSTAEWMPYYSQTAVTISGGNSNTVVSLWKHPDRALLVVGNVNAAAKEFTLNIAPSLGSFTKAMNAETKQPLELKNGTIRISLAGQDCILIELR